MTLHIPFGNHFHNSVPLHDVPLRRGRGVLQGGHEQASSFPLLAALRGGLSMQSTLLVAPSRSFNHPSIASTDAGGVHSQQHFPAESIKQDAHKWRLKLAQKLIDDFTAAKPVREALRPAGRCKGVNHFCNQIAYVAPMAPTTNARAVACAHVRLGAAQADHRLRAEEEVAALRPR